MAKIERMAEELVIDLLKADKTSIPVFLPGETEYERSVANANLLYRFTRPACVVQPKTVGHVQTIVKEAKARNVPITIKCGGHSYAGFSTTDKGISLDLLNMNRVKIDVQSNTVTLQGGALWGHAYKQLVNNRMDGFIINGGRCPTVGVGGFLLGGGLGPFTRSFGMGCDTLKEITIVTADGNKVIVKDTDNPDLPKGKLFWALCGAGGGNFGVVVEFKMYLQKLSNKDGSVVAGRYTWFPKSDKEGTKKTKDKLMDKFMDTMNDFYATRWPDQVTIDTSWICDLKETSSELAVRFLVYYDGTKKDFDKLIVDKLGADKAENGGGELAEQLTRRTMSEKSTRFLHETLVSQWSEETIKAFPTDPTFKLYASFVFKNDLERIKKITSIIREEMAMFKSRFAGESGLLQVTWIHSGGKASRKDRSASAFRWRDGVYQTYIMLDWKEKWMEGEMRAFLKAFKDKLRPFSIMSRAAFINFPDAVLSSATAERTYYGNNTKNLRLVKQQWDPDNFFRWKQGIKLPQTAEKTPTKAKRRSKTSAASPIPAEAFNAFNMSPGASSASLGVGNAFNINALGAPERDYDRRDGLVDGDAVSSDDESPVNEQELTDELATQQWETFTLPPARSLMNLGSRGVLGLTDLGF
ncbi:hypothetical protein QBC32DRAFT_30092 [Pseudoneurospora amorphoporcata]|uniref:FAD-binding PCMH-type domain-containing protein n=1 Tax=Pseudoneurospora amorphoporcata TaxID=241081 RepID=A0AAN6NPR4_9PEZI|nr:hypothetical protein QBC32DRAFT_30092 [Pseudoneurospora amorphoporcata]